MPSEPSFARLSGFARAPGWQWELSGAPSLAAMRETTDFAPWRVVVWGQQHVVSVEVFLELNLAPGEAREWTRVYEFGA